MGAHQPKILVVDDDQAIRSVLRLALDEAGYDVTEAAGGEEALETIRKRRFDLVVLDINMPDLSGYQVLERMRAIPSRADIPVFVVSANGHEPAGMIREVAGGAVGRLRKPFSISELEHAVASALGEASEERAARQERQERAANVYRSLIDLRLYDDREAEPRKGGLLRSGRR